MPVKGNNEILKDGTRKDRLIQQNKKVEIKEKGASCSLEILL